MVAEVEVAAVVAVVEVVRLVTLVPMSALVMLVAMVLVCWGVSSNGSGSIVVFFLVVVLVVCGCPGSAFMKAPSSFGRMSCFRSNLIL